MYNQQLNKSSKETSDLIEKINIWKLRDDIEELKDSLNEMTKEVEKIAHISKIKEFYISMSLHRREDKNFNGSIGKEYYSITDYFYNNYNNNYLTEDFYNKIKYNYFTANFYSGDDIISCSLDYLVDKIKCDSHDGKSFSLSDPHQSCPFPKNIKKKILDILYYDILYPGELMNIGNRYKNMIAIFSMNSKNQTEEDPKISISRSTYDNEFRFEYDGGIFKIEITLL
ncbi:hypothetical protein [Candidatus Nanobsidianus stetteri]|uniref:Uncharacterized protein n=1 Tax=Nanobsidianus stetteri TaxID=1294122 RepID=A0A2T9WL77_NANST|nr:hypothetical protein [Candidatus Nanobsidianus stetteri]MCC5447143.1 hypothetical protein [Candidatus Nanobsidianus stetteri]